MYSVCVVQVQESTLLCNLDYFHSLKAFILNIKQECCVVARVEEVFSWLLEVVEDSSDLWDGGRIVWSVRYVLEGAANSAAFMRGAVNIRQLHSGHGHHAANGGSRAGAQHRPLRDGILEETRRKLMARLEIQKDDIQSVLPISKVSLPNITISL